MNALIFPLNVRVAVFKAREYYDLDPADNSKLIKDEDASEDLSDIVNAWLGETKVAVQQVSQPGVATYSTGEGGRLTITSVTVLYSTPVEGSEDELRHTDTGVGTVAGPVQSGAEADPDLHEPPQTDRGSGVAPPSDT